jgi:hypothetical protein
MPRVPMIAAVLLAAACKPTLDADGIEKAIAGFFAAQLGPVDRVACPDGVEARAGATFTCRIHFAASPPLTVQATHDAEGDGHFALVEPVVATRVITPRIAAWLKSQTGVDAAVDCGAGVQLLPAAGYLCSAPRPDGSKTTIVVRRDAAGELTWSVGP